MRYDPTEIDKLRENLGTFILQERIKRGWSRAQLGQLSGTSRGTILNIENGKHNLQFDSLLKILGALDRSASSVFQQIEKT